VGREGRGKNAMAQQLQGNITPSARVPVTHALSPKGKSDRIRNESRKEKTRRQGRGNHAHAGARNPKRGEGWEHRDKRLGKSRRKNRCFSEKLWKVRHPNDMGRRGKAGCGGERLIWGLGPCSPRNCGEPHPGKKKTKGSERRKKKKAGKGREEASCQLYRKE